jgi:L-rhamnose isomerase
MMLSEEIKTLPFSPIWEHYCEEQGVAANEKWFDAIKDYEKNVQSKRN